MYEYIKLSRPRFGIEAERRLRKLIGNAPLTGKLDLANERLGDKYILAARVQGRRTLKPCIRLNIFDEHETNLAFEVQLPPGCTLDELRMIRTILVIQLLNQTNKRLGDLRTKLSIILSHLANRQTTTVP